jgi:hypothetical protein
MSLPSGTYTIMNDATRTYLTYTTSGGQTRITAKPFENTTNFNFSVVTTGSTSIIRDTGTGTFWVSAPSKPGSEVVASNTAFNWKITPVGNNKYSVTAEDPTNGPVAVQLLSSSNDVNAYVGSHVGANTQQWHFKTVTV